MIPSQQEEPFDFDRYLVKEKVDSKPLAVSEDQSNEPFDFNKYIVKEPPSNSQEIGRHLARTGSRAGEAILGFPGDIIQFTKSLSEFLPKPPEFLRGKPNPIQETVKKGLESIPTSEDLKSVSSYLTSGFTDPQGATEKLGDEITSLATVLVEPAKLVESFPKFLTTLGKAFGKSASAKGAGEAAKLVGASESQQNVAELGTLFLTGLMGKKTANAFVEDQYSKSRSLIPPGTKSDTKNLLSSLDSVEKELSKGISTPTKDQALKVLGDIKNKSASGLIETEELVQSFHDINEIMTSKKLYEELKASERKLLKHRMNKVKDVVSSEIGKYGKINPEFMKNWKNANESFAAIAKSRQVGDFIRSKLGSFPKHLAGSIAMDLFLGHPGTIPAVLGGYGILKTGELLARVVKSPTLRNHYMKVLLEAGNENVPGMIKHLEAINKAAK